MDTRMVRPIRSEDRPTLAAWLASEGLGPDDFGFDDHETFVLEHEGKLQGFYTLRVEWGCLYLQHLFVSPDSRMGRGAKPPYAGTVLFKHLQGVLRARKPRYAIFSAPSENEFVKKCIQKYFRARPYTQGEGLSYFVSEVPNVQ